MRAVNLLPRETHSRRQVTPEQLPVLIAAASAVVVVVALSFGYLSGSAKIAHARQDLNDANAQLAATPLPPSVQKLVTPSAVAAQQQPRLDAVSTALSTRIAWDRILREFSLVLPDDVWLASLTMSAPVSGGAALPGATGLQFTGTTYTYASVARLLSRLSLVPDLTGVQLGSTSKSGPLVSFTVSAVVKGAPVPATPATTTTPSTPGASS
jgi:Tfp pilus assembly protein PilN